MGKLKRRTVIFNSFKSALNYMLVSAACVIAIDYTYVRFAPTSAFFEYSNITNVSAVPGEYAKFYSTSKVSELKPLKSQEEIICLTDYGQLYQIGERVVTFTPSGKSDAFVRSPIWELTSAKLPDIDAICHLEANISMDIRYGIIKYQFIKSTDFSIN